MAIRTTSFDFLSPPGGKQENKAKRVWRKFSWGRIGRLWNVLTLLTVIVPTVSGNTSPSPGNYISPIPGDPPTLSDYSYSSPDGSGSSNQEGSASLIDLISRPVDEDSWEVMEGALDQPPPEIPGHDIDGGITADSQKMDRDRSSSPSTLDRDGSSSPSAPIFSDRGGLRGGSRNGGDKSSQIFGDNYDPPAMSEYGRSSANNGNGGDRKGATSAGYLFSSWNDEYNPQGPEVPDSERLFPLTITDRKLDGRMLSGMGMTRWEGNCAVDGDCFSNLNYGRYEDCTWVVGAAVTDGTLEFSQFNVESHSGCDYDYLLISGTKYCGTTAPTNLVVTAGDEIKWHSDESEQRTGFNVCVTSVTFSCTSTCGAGSGW